MWAKIITIKRTKDLNYFSLCALNLFNTQVSQFELNYWNKWTFPRHSNLLRCTCISVFYFKSACLIHCITCCFFVIENVLAISEIKLLLYNFFSVQFYAEYFLYTHLSFIYHKKHTQRFVKIWNTTQWMQNLCCKEVNEHFELNNLTDLGTVWTSATSKRNMRERKSCHTHNLENRRTKRLTT